MKYKLHNLTAVIYKHKFTINSLFHYTVANDHNAAQIDLQIYHLQW